MFASPRVWKGFIWPPNHSRLCSARLLAGSQPRAACLCKQPAGVTRLRPLKSRDGKLLNMRIPLRGAALRPTLVFLFI